MKKFVNLRLPVVCALCLCAGIALSVALYKYGKSPFWLFAALPAAGLVFAVFCIFGRKFFKTALIFCTCALLFFAIGGIESACVIRGYAKNDVSESNIYQISGRVTEKGKTKYGEYVILTDVSFDGIKKDGKMRVNLSDTYGEWCDEGYTITFLSNVYRELPFEYGKVNDYIPQNIKYRANVYSGVSSTYKFSFLGLIKTSVRNSLYKNLDYETASVAYAMLTGNTQNIGEATLNSFRFGGVAHIFAVSGLHIGLVYASLSFLLKKLRVNRYVSAAISVGAIIFYSAVCGFSVSSVRAVIMCAISALFSVIFRRYDMLNALSAAGIILLVISPFNLYDVGFQLSVCAVGGIAVFSKRLNRLLGKIKIPNKIRGAASASFGASLGTMPIMLLNFNYVSGAGLLLNILVIPVMSAIFVVLFFALLICLVIPPAVIIMPYAAAPLQAVTSFFVSAGLESSLISGFGAGLFAPLYFVGALALSDKINLGFVKRLVSVAVAAVILAGYCIIESFYPFGGYRVVFASTGYGQSALIKSQYGSALIITDDVSYSAIEKIICEQYKTEIDALIILGDDGAQKLAYLDVDYKEVYISDCVPAVQLYPGKFINYTSEFSACGVNFKFLNQNNLTAEVDGVVLGMNASEENLIEKCDLFASDFKNTFTDCGTEIDFNTGECAISVLTCGNLTYKINGGIYALKTNLPPKR